MHAYVNLIEKILFRNTKHAVTYFIPNADVQSLFSYILRKNVTT